MVHIVVIWCSFGGIGTDFPCYLGFNVVSLLKTKNWAMKEYENLKALVYGHDLNDYQRKLAQKEFEFLLHPPQTDVLDELQKHSSEYGGGWICRLSSSGRGLRVHETLREYAMPTIKGAIQKYLSEQALNKKG